MQTTMKRSGVRRGFLLVLLLSVALSSWGGATDAKQPGSYVDRKTGTIAAETMIQNPAPPPPPGAPYQPDKKTVVDDGGARRNTSVGLNGSTAGGDYSIAALTATSGNGLTASSTTSTLILYDTTSQYGWLGELYATGNANLSSYFGKWTAKPVSTYADGDVGKYTATIYFGSTYDEPLPAAFLNDVMTTNKPIIWAYGNIWQLAKLNQTAFTQRYGWNAATSFYDYNTISAVNYKGTALTRYGANGAGILNPQTQYSPFDTTKVTTLATAVRADGTTFPWAIRSANLTYIGEIPFTYMREEDRYLAYADLLFDALAPATTTRHRAMVRLEDINPQSDPVKLRQVADYLASQQVPFGFGLSPLFKDPYGYTTGQNCQYGVQCGPATTVALKDRPALVQAIQYMQSKGGVMILHGYTHQWDGGINPYNGVSGDDFEFFRVVENADHTLTFTGPIPGDSTAWAVGRITSGNQAITDAKLKAPTIFEFPHYAGSATDYRAVATRFPTRWERSLYFGGVLSNGTVDHSRIFGQMFPYAVRDVYGSAVLPENLGSIELELFYQFPTRFPADLINAAQKNLVVRDGVVAFYYHPDFVPLSYLQQTVAGIKGSGYTFVAPSAIVP